MVEQVLHALSWWWNGGSGTSALGIEFNTTIVNNGLIRCGYGGGGGGSGAGNDTHLIKVILIMDALVLAVEEEAGLPAGSGGAAGSGGFNGDQPINGESSLLDS